MAHPPLSRPPVAAGCIVQLPDPVEDLLERICREQFLSPPDFAARNALACLGERAALDILRQISACKIKNFSRFIWHMTQKYSKARDVSTQESVCLSGGASSLCRSLAEEEENQCTSRFVAPLPAGETANAQLIAPFPSAHTASPQLIAQLPSGQAANPQLIAQLPSCQAATTPQLIAPLPSWRTASAQLIALSQLEFRKAFLILSYLGRKKLEETVSLEFIEKVQSLSINQFELKAWDAIGSKCISELDRRKNLDWDSSKAHVYRCHVDLEGNFTFKGPYLQLQRTHLQRVLGDENVLLVKFSKEMSREKRSHGSHISNSIYHKVAEEGILVGLRRFQFFVFKDGGKEEKKKSPTSSSVKCYFVRMESYCLADQEKSYILSDKLTHEARIVFMHVHTVSSLSKYMARFSLILSKTTKLDIDLASVHVEVIEDIPCMDDNGNIVRGENGKPMIHTDGTGFISEDLALNCPRHIFKGKCSMPMDIQKLLDGSKVQCRSLTSEAPLLIQFRLFNNGEAVKGTLLVNKLLPPKTIQVRPSMIKVERDQSISYIQSCNSLEVVTTSNRPKHTCLSRYLTALLRYGGVPNEYFLDLLKNALLNAQNARYSKQAALRVALKYGDMDDFLVSRMILCGIPLDEPYLQFRLSILMKEERKGLKAGKLPVTDCYYLMGTTDPTGLLQPNEVCIILENGQVSGDVLVYKQPGLHFGDIHVLKATYIKDLEKIVGHSKYAIFFPTKGPRSLADEMANSDFDGDMYWVSRNSQLLQYFRSSKPWVRASSMKAIQQKKPIEFSDTELERELFDQFLANRFKPSYTVGMAADCWLSYMDRLLTLGDECDDEKECLKEKILQLVNIYYDALDAPRTGLKVDVPYDLRAEKFPHFMEKSNSYNSTSILGLIYDTANSGEVEDLPSNGISKLDCFAEALEPCLSRWSKLYEEYRKEMASVLNMKHETKESKDQIAEVIQKYKRMLYEAPEFEESPRRHQDIWNDAVAIYNIAYDYAQKVEAVGRCSFAWSVAGRALCMLYAEKQGEKCFIPCLRSALMEILG